MLSLEDVGREAIPRYRNLAILTLDDVWPSQSQYFDNALLISECPLRFSVLYRKGM